MVLHRLGVRRLLLLEGRQFPAQVLPIRPVLLQGVHRRPDHHVAVLLGQDDVVGVGHGQDAQYRRRPPDVEPDGEVPDLGPGRVHPGLHGVHPGLDSGHRVLGQGDRLLGLGQLRCGLVGPPLGGGQVVLAGGRRAGTGGIRRRGRRRAPASGGPQNVDEPPCPPDSRRVIHRRPVTPRRRRRPSTWHEPAAEGVFVAIARDRGPVRSSKSHESAAEGVFVAIARARPVPSPPDWPLPAASLPS